MFSLTHIALVAAPVLLASGAYYFRSSIKSLFGNAEQQVTGEAETIKDDVTGEVNTIDAEAVKVLHAAENDGKVAEGTVEKYVDTHLPTVEADTKAVVTDVKADVQAVEAKL